MGQAPRELCPPPGGFPSPHEVLTLRLEAFQLPSPGEFKAAEGKGMLEDPQVALQRAVVLERELGLLGWLLDISAGVLQLCPKPCASGPS